MISCHGLEYGQLVMDRDSKEGVKGGTKEKGHPPSNFSTSNYKKQQKKKNIPPASQGLLLLTANHSQGWQEYLHKQIGDDQHHFFLIHYALSYQPSAMKGSIPCLWLLF
jgi:hypothetical protein